MGSAILLLLIAMLQLSLTGGDVEISFDFYNQSCPVAVSTIMGNTRIKVMQDRGLGADLLRLHFHNCFVNGCDGSVLLEDRPGFKGERKASQNVGSLEGFNFIDFLKNQVEKRCPGVVSCADILALAALSSTETLSGPSWPLKLGRRDSITASWKDAENDLPNPAMGFKNLTSPFIRKGFTESDMVALSGAHTIGQARCITFRQRIYNRSSEIDRDFARSLRKICPAKGELDRDSPLDIQTPQDFDNSYFRNLVEKRGLLKSDQDLFSGFGNPTDFQVMVYAEDGKAFMQDFGKAMEKMVQLSPLIGNEGEVRLFCNRVNSFE